MSEIVNKEISDTSCANVRILLDVLEKQGLKNYVISPGSRNAPLIIGIAARKNFITQVISDERTAGFYALGMAMVTKFPVALVCTSGTAMYNYAPAIAEAFYQKVPLIVITADRPAQWIDQDDSQTLRQPGALEKIVKRSYNISFDEGTRIDCANESYRDEQEWYVNRVANEAFLTTVSDNAGPVHINIQLASPLGCTVPYQPSSMNTRMIRIVNGVSDFTKEDLKETASELFNKKILVVAGFMSPDNKLNRTISVFSQWPNVALMCETISNLHVDSQNYMIDSLLSKLDSKERQSLSPDIIISIGGALVSRMLKEFIRECKGTEHWTLEGTDVSMDCFQRLTTHFNLPPERFFSGINRAFRKFTKRGFVSTSAEYGASLDSARKSARKIDNLYDLRTWSELKALKHVFKRMPDECNLVLSNGTPIRYSQLLIEKLPHACYCNRGVSGIDGAVATALGASAAYKRMTLLVTGDMSFSYCPEALNLIEKGGDLRIVVVNNRGGGIFRFIKTTKSLDIREKFFCNDPQLPIKKIAESYRWHYLSARSEEEIKSALDQLFCIPRSLLEIFVDPEESANTLTKFLNNCNTLHLNKI